MDIKSYKHIGQEPQSPIESKLRKEKISFSSIHDTNTAKVLDVGCGSGDVFDGIELKAVVDAIEPDEVLKGLAVNKNIYNNIFTSVDEVDVSEYDYVTILGVLEHIEDRQSFLRLYKDAKKIFITVPNGHSFHRLLGVELKMIESPCALIDQDIAIGHKIVFNESTLRREVQHFCDCFNFKITKIGSSSFKFTSNTEMGFFADRFASLSKVAENAGLIGLNKFYGGELFIEIESINGK